MSTDEDIAAVYNEDINRQSRLVESKFGKSPFYEGFSGFSFGDIYENSGAEKIACSEFSPKIRKWSRKYGKSCGEKA